MGFPSARARFAMSRLPALGLLLAALLVPVSGALAANEGRAVDVVEAHGVVDHTLANHVVDVIEQANAGTGEVVLVIVEIDSPGALGDSAERVVAAVEASQVPIVAWVGPPGAWAVGGALAIGQAADLLAAAPGTLLGPATPLDLTDDRDADAGALAVAPDGAPGAALPADAPLPDGVTPADVSVRPGSDLVASGVLDLVAGTLPELVEALDGREVGGDVLDTAASTVRFINLGIAGQVLHALTSPTLVYLLVVGGALALLFEVFQPGFGVAGVCGLAVLALGAAGLAVLPTSWLGIALAAAGLLLLAADLALGKLGPLTVAGSVVFAAGSIMLFTGPPLLDIPYWLVGVATVFNMVFFVGIMTSVLRAQGNQALVGAERLVGETAVVRSMLNPEGHIFVKGALWRARAQEEAGRIRSGTAVRVIGLDDRLTLEVEPLDDDAKERDRASSPVP